MINIIKTASEICNIAGKADDIATVRRVQIAIQDYCTRFIRDTISSNKVIPSGVVIHIQKNIEDIDNMSKYYISPDIKCKRTSSVVSTPLRLFDNTPFMSVSSPSNSIMFSYVPDVASIGFEIGGRFSSANRYTFHNGYLYLYTSNRIMLGASKINISFIPENPLDIIDEGGTVAFNLENYPAPADLLSIIKVEILKNLFPNVKPSIEEITVDD